METNPTMEEAFESFMATQAAMKAVNDDDVIEALCEVEDTMMERLASAPVTSLNDVLLRFRAWMICEGKHLNSWDPFEILDSTLSDLEKFAEAERHASDASAPDNAPGISIQSLTTAPAQIKRKKKSKRSGEAVA